MDRVTELKQRKVIKCNKEKEKKTGEGISNYLIFIFYECTEVYPERITEMSHGLGYGSSSGDDVRCDTSTEDECQCKE